MPYMTNLDFCYPDSYTANKDIFTIDFIKNNESRISWPFLARVNLPEHIWIEYFHKFNPSFYISKDFFTVDFFIQNLHKMSDVKIFEFFNQSYYKNKNVLDYFEAYLNLDLPKNDNIIRIINTVISKNILSFKIPEDIIDICINKYNYSNYITVCSNQYLPNDLLEFIINQPYPNYSFGASNINRFFRYGNLNVNDLISKHQKLSKKFISKYIDKLNFDLLLKNNNLDKIFVEKLALLK